MSCKDTGMCKSAAACFLSGSCLDTGKQWQGVTPTPASQPSPAPICPTCKGERWVRDLHDMEQGLIRCEKCKGASESPSPARIEKLARAVVATYDDPHSSLVAVERAIGMLRKELALPSPARSDMPDTDLALWNAFMAECGPHGSTVPRSAMHTASYRAAHRAGWLDRAAQGRLAERTPSSDSPEVVKPWRDRYDDLAKTLNEPPNELRAERRKSACRDAEIADLRAVLARRATAGTTAPAGFKLVPVEPTPDMQQAGHDTPGAHMYNASYRAMVNAAPGVAGTTAPVLYVRQWELDAEPLSSKHGIVTSRTVEDDWNVPLYLAATAVPGDLPQIPTEAMLNAARDWSVKKYGIGIGNDAAIGCWQAMIAAAPSNPPVGATQPQPDGWVAPAIVGGERTSVAFADEQTARAVCVEGEPFAFRRLP